MTEIQQTNIAVANYIIGELHKDKPFNLVLDTGETGALYHIASESHHLHSGKAFKDVFGLPSGVVKSLGEVS